MGGGGGVCAMRCSARGRHGGGRKGKVVRGHAGVYAEMSGGGEREKRWRCLGWGSRGRKARACLSSKMSPRACCAQQRACKKRKV